MSDHPTSPDDTLAEQVKRLRRRRAWSQEHLAAASGVSLRTVQRVETGQPCAPETIQALAAALQVDAESLSRAAPAPGLPERRFGLTPRQASWAGVLLCAPATFFIVSNLGVHAAGWPWARALFPGGTAGALLAHPLVVLGGPALAALWSLPHLLELRRRPLRGGWLIEGVLVAPRLTPLAVLALGSACLATLLAYAVTENLGHWLNGLAAG